MKWIHLNGGGSEFDMCAYAASENDISLLIWARNNGCKLTKHTFTKAVTHGHLAVLDWLLQNRCPCDRDEVTKAANSKQK